jgi:hypothetical protein
MIVRLTSSPSALRISIRSRAFERSDLQILARGVCLARFSTKVADADFLWRKRYVGGIGKEDIHSNS